MNLAPEYKERLEEALSHTGQRPTRQREHVFSVILEKRDHPTADEIYARARSGMPTISLATVYNCLDTLVESGLVRQVNFDREPTRYCPNLTQHAHFYCKESGEVVDVDLPEKVIAQLKAALPKGFVPQHINIAYHGQCPGCKDD
ncbi:MAG: Fur family transcriptional regulator [Coraliomargarita sp.]